jgi:hypothetical protein
MSEVRMKRQRNVIWEPPNEWRYVQLQVLMDIREELANLNSLLRCPNFLRIPLKLDRISKNTAKPRPKRKVRS